MMLEKDHISNYSTNFFLFTEKFFTDNNYVLSKKFLKTPHSILFSELNDQKFTMGRTAHFDVFL